MRAFACIDNDHPFAGVAFGGDEDAAIALADIDEHHFERPLVGGVVAAHFEMLGLLRDRRCPDDMPPVGIGVGLRRVDVQPVAPEELADLLARRIDQKHIFIVGRESGECMIGG